MQPKKNLRVAHKALEPTQHGFVEITWVGCIDYLLKFKTTKSQEKSLPYPKDMCIQISIDSLQEEKGLIGETIRLHFYTRIHSIEFRKLLS